MVLRLIRRALAVAIMVGGLSFVAGPPAHATATCTYLRVYNPRMFEQFCVSNPF